ncbi:hypothetical protein ACFWTE_01135 [Nocardiopsis sp. NPDC058631]|uniref:hypothetical protein n=1 Tax=Nocardiopsis sp. NPDC058631 TaxID=3346566 RepID=UPI00365A69B5
MTRAFDHIAKQFMTLSEAERKNLLAGLPSARSAEPERFHGAPHELPEARSETEVTFEVEWG